MRPSASAGSSYKSLETERPERGSGLFNFSPNLAVLARSRSFMGWVDIVLCGPCHDIIGIIAVQHKQFNFRWQGTKRTSFALALLVAGPALAGSIVQPSKPDPLLDGGPTSACAAGVDYAAGIDVNGQPVVPADTAARPVPVPDSVAIPIGRRAPGQNAAQGGAAPNPASPGAASNRDSSYIALDGKKLEPLLNPPPCGAVH